MNIPNEDRQTDQETLNKEEIQRMNRENEHQSHAHENPNPNHEREHNPIHHGAASE